MGYHLVFTIMDHIRMLIGHTTRPLSLLPIMEETETNMN
jgi:hypothetical protein